MLEEAKCLLSGVVFMRIISASWFGPCGNSSCSTNNFAWMCIKCLVNEFANASICFVDYNGIKHAFDIMALGMRCIHRNLLMRGKCGGDDMRSWKFILFCEYEFYTNVTAKGTPTMHARCFRMRRCSILIWRTLHWRLWFCDTVVNHVPVSKVPEPR